MSNRPLMILTLLGMILAIVVGLSPIDGYGRVVSGPGGPYGLEQHDTGTLPFQKLTVIWLGPVHWTVYIPAMSVVGGIMFVSCGSLATGLTLLGRRNDPTNRATE